MKFQNSSIQKLCYASKSVTDARTDRWMDARTNVPEAICPTNFFEVRGINIIKVSFSSTLILRFTEYCITILNLMT